MILRYSPVFAVHLRALSFEVSRAKASALEAALDTETSKNRELEGANAELEGRNSVLRRKLQDAEDDKRRMAREMETFWQDSSPVVLLVNLGFFMCHIYCLEIGQLREMYPEHFRIWVEI